MSRHLQGSTRNAGVEHEFWIGPIAADELMTELRVYLTSADGSFGDRVFNLVALRGVRAPGFSAVGGTDRFRDITGNQPGFPTGSHAIPVSLHGREAPWLYVSIKSSSGVAGTVLVAPVIRRGRRDERPAVV